MPHRGQSRLRGGGREGGEGKGGRGREPLDCFRRQGKGWYIKSPDSVPFAFSFRSGVWSRLRYTTDAKAVVGCVLFEHTPRGIIRRRVESRFEEKHTSRETISECRRSADVSRESWVFGWQPASDALGYGILSPPSSRPSTPKTDCSGHRQSVPGSIYTHYLF